MDRSRDGGERPNPLGDVPVVPLANKPGLLRGGESDLKPAMPIQNAINKLCTDMLVASEYGAFRQRVLTGVEVPRDPETGKPLGEGADRGGHVAAVDVREHGRRR